MKAEIKRKMIRTEVIERKLDEIFGENNQEIQTATTNEKIMERFAEMAKRE